jgi:hypothetical protein
MLLRPRVRAGRGAHRGATLARSALDCVAENIASRVLSHSAAASAAVTFSTSGQRLRENL